MTPASPVLANKPTAAREVTFAKDQPEYRPLPAIVAVDGMVTSRWRLSLRERINVLLRGDLYVQVLTFGQPLQPIKLSATEPSAD